MIQIFNDKYWTVLFNEELNIIETQWTAEAQEMTDNIFKEYITVFAQLIEKYKPNGFLTDARNGHYAVAPALQEWHDNEIIPIYIKTGVLKIAFVLPPDIFAAVALQQTFDEVEAKKLTVLHFDDYDSAIEWIRK